MKKLMTILGAIFIVSAIMTSCGGGKKEKIALPAPPTDLKYEGVTLVDGPLSKYIEVVPGSYLFEIAKEETYSPRYEGTMKVKFKFIKSIDVKAGSGYNYYGPSLNGKALDEQGAPLKLILSVSTDKDLATYLKRGSGEEWLTLNISSGNANIKTEEDAVKLLEEFKKGKKIRFNSEIVEEKFDSGSSSSSSSNSESNKVSSSSGDCDDFLDGYEKFMDNYIAVLKKYKNNPTDASIISDYTSLMSEASEWSTKTADCAADAKYAAKFAAIAMKIVNAASGM